MSDLTNGGRERAIEALRASEELHRATLSNISDAVFVTDDDGAFTFICPNVDVIFGYVPDEVAAMTRISRLLGENLFDRKDLATSGEIRNLEREVTSKSGDQRTVLIHVKAVSIQGGTVLYTCRDVTERKQAEEELRTVRLDLAHASRLALVGELMASIAHEVSQPLASIVANAGAALLVISSESAGKSSEVQSILTDIREQGHAAGAVIARLRTLSGKRPLELRPLDMNEVVIDMLRLVASDARRRSVTLESELAASLPVVNADRVCLQQVLLNLIVNAMDEMDDSQRQERILTVSTSPRAGSVEVAVSDTASGIPPDRMPKLFDAFFTTKKDGMGLGLAIARSIVEAHGGHIRAENSSRGAIFRFSVPVQP